MRNIVSVFISSALSNRNASISKDKSSVKVVFLNPLVKINVGRSAFP